MARMKIIPVEELSPEQRKEYDACVAAGTPTGMQGPAIAFARSPGFMLANREMYGYLHKHSSLPSRQRQILVIQTVKHLNAQFPLKAQIRNAPKWGLEQPITDALAKGEDPVFSSPQDAALYQFGKELIRTHQVADATYQRALELFGEVGISDMITTIGYFFIIGLAANAIQADPPQS